MGEIKSDNVGKGAIFIVLSSLLFGSYGVWSKLIGSSFGVFYQGWVRSLIICLIVLPTIYFAKQIVPIKRADLKWFAVFLIFTSFTTAPIFYAFTHMAIGTAYLLFFVGMLITMYIVGFSFFGEKITGIKLIAFATTCIGLYAVFSFSIENFVPLAAFMALLNGIASGGEIAFSKKLSGSYSPLFLSWLSWFAILITNGIISVAIGEIQHAPAFNMVWLYLVVYAVAGIIGFWLVLKGIQYLESSIGSLLTPLEVVFGIIFGIMIFNEALTPSMLFGGTLIIVAAALPHVYRLVIQAMADRRNVRPSP
ncbi:MAG: DMT family transporter [Candidatus Liptonbacteria bacterium]|nr:DMT family transporter [Candidatus Liptonbacteria bacterium]